MSGRGQSTLVSLAVALLLVTAACGLAVAFAATAFAGVDRGVADERLADALASRTVAADGPLTTRANVLNESEVDGLTGASFERAFPAARGHAVRVSLDGETLVETGDVSDGATVRRVALVAERQSRAYEPSFAAGPVTLPRRTDALDVSLDQPAGVSVTAVTVDGRVVLADPSGLRGDYRVAVSPYRAATVDVDANRTLTAGDVRLVAHPVATHKADLVVRVDA